MHGDPAMQASELEATLLEAHARGDCEALSRLYAQASHLAEAAGESDRAGFFLTQAWVFALDAGLEEARAFERRLRALGRT
jgi:hypothetical protein